MGYVLRQPRGLGDVAEGDFVAILAAQKNEARRAFGSTSLNMPGRTDVQYPNITGSYTTRLVDYWQREAERILAGKGVVDTALKNLFGSQAHFDAWKRKVLGLSSLTMLTIRAKAITTGQNLMPQGDAKTVWSAVEDVVIPMNAIKTTPSEWELMKEAVAETLPDIIPKLPGLPDFGGVIRVAFYGSLAYGLYWLWNSSKGGR
jgi:hypothetical protein